jgi:proteasome lid subunit RPN8/RPN11
MRRLSVAMTEQTNEILQSHLLRADGQEDLCFVLYRRSTGAGRTTGLVGKVILPRPDERNLHGNVSFNAPYFLRALGEAEDAGCGLGLVHSHPSGSGWQDMSSDDVDAERSHAAQAWAVTDLPLLGMTLAGDGSWSAREWFRSGRGLYERADYETARVVGEQLAITRHAGLRPPYPHDRRMVRTVSAWGEGAQDALTHLHVGVVGLGSVGMLVAEALARTGVRRISLIDFDSVKLHNLDRLAHATRLDAALATPKVDVAKRALLNLAPVDDLVVNAVRYSVVEDHGFRAALDCDVLFSCVDRPWPRQILDHAAFAHLIPVVDGGISVGAIPRFTRADWKAQVVAPGRRCLECCGQYSAADVALERVGDLDDPSYIEGLPADHRLRASENVYAFSQSVASMEMLQFLSLVIAPLGFGDVGEWNFHFVSGRLDVASAQQCEPYCAQQPVIARGDSADSPTGEHAAALDQRRLSDAVRGRTLVSAAASAHKWLDRRRRDCERELARRVR